MPTSPLTLEQQKLAFKNSKLLATPLAGLVAWFVVFLSSIWSSDQVVVYVLFIATGCIVYLGLGFSKLTGEDFLSASRPKNTFDRLFFYTVAQSLLVYAIAIPFFLIDYTSLPLTIGILTGLMWLPISWLIDHWIGMAHAVVRTLTIVALWYLFPADRFTAISLAIVLIYLFTIRILIQRYKTLHRTQHQSDSELK